MNELTEILSQRMDALNKIIHICKKSLSNPPKGTLRAVIIRGKARYYHRVNTTDRTGKYLNSKKINTAVRLAQRDYYQAVLKAAVSELESIEMLMKVRAECVMEDCYDRLIEARKVLVSPLTDSDEEYARKWQDKPFTPKKFDPDDKSNYYSRKGERMRSKSEVLIANLLYDLGIPYRYECPLLLENGRTIYPDFTVLNKRTRKIYYLEHLGIMGQEKYAADNAQRLNDMILSGLILGKNLIVTIESSTMALNTKALEAQIRAIFL